MAEKKKALRMTSPKGVAQYAFLNKPDTKYDADGVYRVKLILSDGFEEFQGKLDALLKDSLKEAKEQDKGAEAIEPYEFNEDGAMVLSFKMKAQFKDKKDGSIVKMKPQIADGTGKTITKEVKIGNGSVIKVAFKISNYFVPGQPKKKLSATAGIRLQLEGVQILKLVEYGGSLFSADEDAEYEYEEGDDEIQEQEGTNAAEDSDEEDF